MQNFRCWVWNNFDEGVGKDDGNCGSPFTTSLPNSFPGFLFLFFPLTIVAMCHVSHPSSYSDSALLLPRLQLLP